MKYFLLLFAIVFLSTSTLKAGSIKIEAESFFSFYNIDADTIRWAPAPGTSGEMILAGLGYPEEWVKYHLSITNFGTYSISIMVRGELGTPYSLRAVFIPVGSSDPPQTIDFNLTGNGYA